MLVPMTALERNGVSNGTEGGGNGKNGYGKKEGKLTITDPPIIKIHDGKNHRPPPRPHVRRRDQGHIDQHGPPQQITQRPLNPIILIPPIRPRTHHTPRPIRQRRTERRAGHRGRVPDPRRIHQARQPVGAELAGQPTERRGQHGGDDEAARAPEGGFGDAGEGGVDLAGAHLLAGFERVDVAGEDGEDGDGGAAHDQAA